MGNKDQIAALKKLSYSFLADRKNANNLVDIMIHLQTEEEDVLMVCVRTVHKVFVHLIYHGEMYLHQIPMDKASKDDLDTDAKYKLWLQEQYTECRQRLLELLTYPDSMLQELALCSLMKFMEAEGNTPLKNISEKHLAFPVHCFEQVIHHLLSSDVDMHTLIQRFQEYLEYDDVRYFAMKHTISNMKQQEEKAKTAEYLGNVLMLLEQLSMYSPPEDEMMMKFLTKLPELACEVCKSVLGERDYKHPASLARLEHVKASESKLKINTYKEHKKLFTSVWLELLKQQMPTSLYKRVLVILHEKVMPYMTSPLLLADFLTESFNIGGAISLLALNGIFILVNSYNLEYPDFFKKLYSLFDPTVFHVKYRARFFFLADLFLTSTHIPAYLVAAFAKKLARLCLVAPPNGLAVAVPFIYNLLVRHPNCKVLLHRPDGPRDINTDPFKMDEPDPAKCNAMDSSLWELKTLQNHYHYAISREAKKMEQPLPKEESDISNLLETTTDDLYTGETRKKIKTVPTTFDPPKGIFSNKDDQFKDLWLLY